MTDPDHRLLQAAKRLQNPLLQLIYGALPVMQLRLSRMSFPVKAREQNPPTDA